MSPFHSACRMGVLLLLFLLSHRFSVASDCASAKQEWVRLRYTSWFSNLPSTVNTGGGGPLTKEICPVSGGPRCCDQNMEWEMYALGHRQLLHQPNWLQVAEQMNNDSNALEYFFRSDLEQAKNRLHQFFSRIYGYNYKLHRSFFFRFFTDLEEYMSGRRGRLASLVDNFFSQLRDNIVSLIERSGQLASVNPTAAAAAGSTLDRGRTPGGTAFDLAASSGAGGAGGGGYAGSGTTDEAAETRRIRCLSERVAQLRPFDEVDVRLKARLLEAYPPARMLVNVMSTTSRLLSHLAVQVSERPECVLGLTRFQFCALCAGQPLTAVCPDSCPRLLASCLHVNGPESAQLTAIWPRLIEAIVLATTRLERSFNFPAVNRNLQMEISEAITSLQARYEQTKSKFEAECRIGSAGRAAPTLFSSGGSAGTGNQFMNPGGNHMNRPQSAGLNPSSFSGWPPAMNGGFRWKRDTAGTAHRGIKLHARSPQMASPEFLDWQVRPRSSMNMGGYQPASRSNAYSGAMDYRQGAQPEPNTAWSSGPSDGGASDVPERLMRWAGQLKRAYTALGNLFLVPGANFCPAVSPNRANNTGAAASAHSPNCWNPPPLTDSTPHQGIAETLKQLAEATERLHQASANNGDPDALAIHLSPVVNPAFGTFSSQAALKNPYVDQKQQQHQQVPQNGPSLSDYSRTEQWRPPFQPPAAVSNEAPPVEQEFAGSGAGPHPNGQLPLIENQAPQDFYDRAPLSPPAPINYNQPAVAPPTQGPDPDERVESQGSGRGDYEPGEPYYEAPPVPEPRFEGGNQEQQPGEKPDDDVEDEEPVRPLSPPVTTLPPFSVLSTSTMASTSTEPVTTVSTTTDTTTTTIITTTTRTSPPTEPTSTIATTPLTAATTAATRSHTPSTPAPPPVVVPPGNSWRSPETGHIGSTKPPASLANHRGPSRSRFESSHASNQGAPLPDDEDSLPQPDSHQGPIQPPESPHAPRPFTPPPDGLWHGAPQAAGQPTWWENPQSGGSGQGAEAGNYEQPAGSYEQPAGLNNQNQYYNWVPGWDKAPEPPSSPVDGGAPPYDYMGGSGMKPPGSSSQASVTGPEVAKPDPGFSYQGPQTGAEFGQPAPEWDRPRTPEDLDNIPGQGSGNWQGPDGATHPGGINQWQDSAQGSGTAETVGYLPEISQTTRPPDPLPQPPALLPPLKKPEPAYYHPPMPPPEVWVPAQLSPGQSMSSVLLVREYNVQGPFYGPESSHSKPSSAVTNHALIILPTTVSLMLHFFLI